MTALFGFLMWTLIFLFGFLHRIRKIQIDPEEWIKMKIKEKEDYEYCWMNES